MTRRRNAICMLTFAVTLGVGGFTRPALGQLGHDAEARELFRSGTEALQAGRVAEACPLFELSLEFARVPWTAQNLGYCYHLAGRELEAIDVLGQILAGDFGEISEETRVRSAELIHDAEERLARLTVTTTGPTSAQIRVDGEEPEAIRDLPLDPGRHVISAMAAGFQPVEEVVELGPGSEREVELSLLPTPTREESDGTLPLVIGITLGVLVLSGATVAVLLLTESGPEEDPSGVVPITEVLHSPIRF